jgi:undecaprenyl-diphosphatase
MAMLELIEDIAKLGLIVAALYSALSIYVRRRWPAWAESLGRRRLGVLLMLIFAMIAIKVSEDVLGQESGPMD